MSDIITLRTHLIGSLSDLFDSACLGAPWKCSMVCELASLFADYQEEGASLFLDAFLTDNLDPLTAPIPQSHHQRLGVTTANEEGVKRAVKKTAPLVRGCWKMYLSSNGADLDFGLFRDSGHPLNVPIDLALQSGGVGKARFIRITKLTHDVVRVYTHSGKQCTIHFTNALVGSENTNDSIIDLCDIICTDLDEKRAQVCKTYISSLLSKAVRESHGSLIAVVNTRKIPSMFDDCTKLETPLDVMKVVESVRLDSTTIPQLYALESLVHGMFGCDGIVVFNTHAQILAYSAFVKLKASNVAGGARKRAYQALCEKVGGSLKAAFFQSQDGACELRRQK